VQSGLLTLGDCFPRELKAQGASKLVGELLHRVKMKRRAIRIAAFEQGIKAGLKYSLAMARRRSKRPLK